MKKYIFFLLLLASSASLLAQDKINRKEVAKTVFDLLQKKEYEKVLTYMDTAYQHHVSKERLELMWNNVVSKGGTFKNTREMVENVQANYAVVYIPCVFEKRVTNIKFIFNKRDQIVGLNFLPEDQKEKYKLPSYYDSTRVTELNFRINGLSPLPATLTLPKGAQKTPAVILIHGSGANDRDETVNSTKIFKDIAVGLAARGIAVLRYDKRSKTYQLRVRKKEMTPHDETIDDVVAAFKSLKGVLSVDTTKIFLIGHGFGGMLLPLIAKELPEVAGLFIIGANAGPLEDLIYEQTAYLLSLDTMTDRKKTMLDSMKVQVNKIKQLTDADAADTSLSRLLFHPKPYWVELNKYHQLEVAKETLVPMYFLHGERDYQVSMKDFNAWKTALALKKNAHFKLYPKLNHMLQEGVGKSSPDEYNKVGNVPLYVINDLAGWIIPKTVPISIPKTIPKTTPKTTPKKK